MKNRLLLGCCLVAIAVLAVLWLRPDTSRKADPASPGSGAATTSQSARVPAEATRDDGSATANTVPAKPAPTDAAAIDPTVTFRIDNNGKLILDEQTRLSIEALFARTDPADLSKAQEEIVQKLPPAAAAEASALLDRYDNYSKAQRQAYPPGAAPATEEAALAELEGMHALRVAHFGHDTAKALYGAEEALTRSLIELMRLEKDQSLTLEEKAARAQQLYDTLPELSRVQRSN